MTIKTTRSKASKHGWDGHLAFFNISAFVNNVSSILPKLLDNIYVTASITKKFLTSVEGGFLLGRKVFIRSHCLNPSYLIFLLTLGQELP